MSIVEQTYDASCQYEWTRLERHRVEYGLTLRALAWHLPPAPARVADVGGGVGRYAIELARQGYSVTLADIAGKALDFARDRAGEAGASLEAVVKADARDLSAMADGSFDAVLLMGPLYHLLEHADRLRAVREARRILRPGGLIFAAFITPYIVVMSALVREIEYVARSRDELEMILASGVYRRPAGRTKGFPDAWFSRPERIGPLMSEGGFEQLDLLNTESLARELEASVNAAPEDLHQQWLDLLYRLARDPGSMASGGHLLYVGRSD